MTSKDFRRLALDLPEAVEQAHMGTPDFRIRGKIFASVSEARAVATLKLRLEPVDVAAARSALGMAWHNVAPKRLVAERAYDFTAGAAQAPRL